MAAPLDISWHTPEGLNKRIFLLGFLDNLASSLFTPLITRHLIHIGASYLSSGFILSLFGITQSLSAPVVGQWSDRGGRRRVLLICALFTTLSCFLLSLSFTIWIFVISRCLAGIFKHTQVLSKSYLADIVEPVKRSWQLGMFNSACTSAFIVGPFLAGFIAELDNGFMLLCGIGTGIFAVNTVLMALFLPELHSSTATKSPSWTSLIRGSFVSFEWRELWQVFLVRFLIKSSSVVFFFNKTIFLEEAYEMSLHTIGYVTSLTHIMEVICGFLVGPISDLFHRRDSRLALIFSLGNMLALAGLTFAPSLFWYIAFLVPWSLSHVVLRVILTNLTLDIARNRDIATMVGLGQSVAGMSRTMGPVLAGASREYFGRTGPGSLGALLCGMAAVVVRFTFP